MRNFQAFIIFPKKKVRNQNFLQNIPVTDHQTIVFLIKPPRRIRESLENIPTVAQNILSDTQGAHKFFLFYY